MALSDAAWRASIVAQLGDTPDGQLDGLIGTFWDRYPGLTGGARAWAATGDALIFLIGQLMPRLDDPTLTEDQVTAVRTQLAIRQAQQQTASTQLATLSAGGTRGSRGPRAGQLTTTAPGTVPTGYPDPNDPRYRGAPYPLPPLGRVQR